MTAPDERFPRPRALRDRLSRRPRLSPQPGPAAAAAGAAHRRRRRGLVHLPGRRRARSPGPTASRRCSAARPADHELSRQILARHVHRDDHAKALGAITRAWTAREAVRTTVRLMRADGGWFDVDCRLEPVTGPDGTVTRHPRLPARRLRPRTRPPRGRPAQPVAARPCSPSIIERDPATGLLTRARFADEIDRAQRRGGGAVLVVSGSSPTAPTGVRSRATPSCCSGPRACWRAWRPPGDLLGRAGPNEIAVLLPGASWAMARRQADLFVEALRDPAVRAARRLAARPRLGRAGPLPAGAPRPAATTC